MALGLALSGLLGAGISALGSLGGSVINRNANLAAVREQNRGNMELAKYKYDRDVEMWNAQNEYNSPSAQMARFAQAGLNPNFMYGQGSNGNATSAPSFETPTLNAYTQQDFGIGAAAAGGVDAYQKFLQIENAQKVQNSVIAKNNAEAVGQELRNANQIVANARDAFEYGILTKYRKSEVEASLQQSYANIRKMQSETTLNYDRSATEKAREDLVIRQADHELDKIGLTRLQRAHVLSQIDLINANIQKIGAEVVYIQEHTGLTREQALESVLRQQGLFKQNEILEKTGIYSAVSKIFAPFIPKIGK